jgi:hypothetical protein
MVLTSDGVDRWLLTCHHVLAHANGTLAPTDRVFQPNAANGVVATLAGALFDQSLDCAAALLSVPASNEVLGLGTLAPATSPTAGMKVIKSGWKTGVSEGVIQTVNGTDVIIERLPGYPLDYLVAASGDSGAVWVEASTLAPVALHKQESAVGPHRAFATDIGAVLAALNLQQV